MDKPTFLDAVHRHVQQSTDATDDLSHEVATAWHEAADAKALCPAHKVWLHLAQAAWICAVESEGEQDMPERFAKYTRQIAERIEASCRLGPPEGR